MDTFTDLEELNLFLIQSSQADADEVTVARGGGAVSTSLDGFSHIIERDPILGGDQNMINKCKCMGSFRDFVISL